VREREREREGEREGEAEGEGEGEREGVSNKMSFKDMSPVIYFLQPAPTSHQLPIIPSNFKSISGLSNHLH
jgi:hypothetical protein